MSDSYFIIKSTGSAISKDKDASVYFEVKQDSKENNDTSKEQIKSFSISTEKYEKSEFKVEKVKYAIKD